MKLRAVSRGLRAFQALLIKIFGLTLPRPRDGRGSICGGGVFAENGRAKNGNAPSGISARRKLSLHIPPSLFFTPCRKQKSPTDGERQLAAVGVVFSTTASRRAGPQASAAPARGPEGGAADCELDGRRFESHAGPAVNAEGAGSRRAGDPDSRQSVKPVLLTAQPWLSREDHRSARPGARSEKPGAVWGSSRCAPRQGADHNESLGSLRCRLPSSPSGVALKAVALATAFQGISPVAPRNRPPRSC